MTDRSRFRALRASAAALLALGLSASGAGLAPWGDARSSASSPPPSSRISSPLPPVDWRPREPVPIAVRDGFATFDAPNDGEAGGDLLVVVSSLAPEPGPFSVRLSARGVDRARPPERAPESPIREPALTPPRPPADVAAPLLPPEPHRDFHVMVREGDVGGASNYQKVRGTLRAIGERVQVYVAEEDVERVDAETLADVVDTFDAHVRPVAARTIGLADDADGDGRFTVFFSSWLARLGGGRHAVDGYVRVTDLDPGYPAPFGNRCDMMYLSTDLRAGPHLRTVMAHEYTHAVVFTRKCLHRGADAGTAIEEEGWLDEALAHLCEDLHGFTRSNLDHRVSAFLSRPERYRLVVDDYYAADLFRSHGNRGSTYLFLRWCADRYGPDLLPTLAGSGLRGAASLEAATGRAFEDLFRDWTTELYLEADGSPSPAFTGFRTGGSDGPWLPAGPRPTRVEIDGEPDVWEAAGTSPHYAIIDGGGAKAVEVRVEGPDAARLQVTAVRLPRSSRLAMSARTYTAANGDVMLRVSAREQGGGVVKLLALGWEPLTPPADPRRSPTLPGRLVADDLAEALGGVEIPADATLDSRPIRLGDVPPSIPLVVKLLGRDARGLPVTAWATLNDDPIAPSPTIAREAGDDPARSRR
ncbi:hypothetical protein [Planctomyces sp. SH-PL62]|uniref:hypothetical protein n=1 Tax=Planctomyces sp. SH-PL62 TaxID=1636152 RepID=UPI00078B699C|nr:hypothetical protein [Planctomyces sp. SH-PL62]AMV35876.1 Neutral metalloprotease precursor [Planctomyces sp. SH-PL62]